MPVFVYGPMEFKTSDKAVTPISELAYDLTLETDQQDADGQKPSTYIKNIALATLSFDIAYKKSLGSDPRTEWGRWAATLNARIPYPLILGGKPLGADMWLVVGVSASEYIYVAEELVSLILTVNMDEYVRPGKKEAEASAGGSGGGTSEKTGKAVPPERTNAQIADKAKKLLSSKK